MGDTRQPSAEGHLREIEIRQTTGFPHTCEGRIIDSWPRHSSDGKITKDRQSHHAFPRHGNPPGAKTFYVGGYPYWLRRRGFTADQARRRVKRALQAWVDAQEREQEWKRQTVREGAVPAHQDAG